ncbi:hypothetical protein [Actinotalea solisilvae]|uniref:hypothetical protein n=1 Tax=Actinotalea solisilvae TaxID=2072922 RepID=UPI001F348F91|nr:hypothetical protein [Actinotalea solisilvae]
MTTTAQHAVPATPARQYYRVKDAARVLGVPPRTLPTWSSTSRSRTGASAR